MYHYIIQLYVHTRVYSLKILNEFSVWNLNSNESKVKSLVRRVSVPHVQTLNAVYVS